MSVYRLPVLYSGVDTEYYRSFMPYIVMRKLFMQALKISALCELALLEL